MKKLFFGFVFGVAALGVCLPARAFSPAENRYLEQKPKFSWKAFFDGSYGESYEAYLSDQFPARETWVRVKTGAERLQGREDGNGVYFGKDGYLIEKFDREAVETEQLSKNLDGLAAFVKKQQDSLGENRVRVMLVPSVSQILEDKLPLFAAPYDQGQVTELLAGRLTEIGADKSAVVPVEEELKRHGEEPVFYRTDHHWTSLGAYYGYRAWAKSAGLTPWPQEAFEVTDVSHDFYGTVQAKVGTLVPPDTMLKYTPRQPVSYRVTYDGGGEEREGLYTEEALETRDQYFFYLDGNHGLTEIKNQDIVEKDDRRLLIVKDSFANSFAPFAVNHFGRTYMVDLRYFNASLDVFMEREKITDVLVLYRIPGFATDTSVWKLK